LLHTNSKQEQENDSLSNIQNNHSLEWSHRSTLFVLSSLCEIASIKRNKIQITGMKFPGPEMQFYTH
jgi:hypothetical protein